MTDTYKPDSTEQPSTYTRGVTNAKRTRATRIGHVFSLTDEVDLKSAADQVYASDGAVHPDNSLLPLKTITAQRLQPNIVRVRSEYNLSGSYVPTATASQLTRIYGGHYNFRTWHKNNDFDSQGRPKGGLNVDQVSTPGLQNRNRPPRPYYVEMPQWTLQVPTILSSNPTSTVAPLKGMINQDAVVDYSGYTWPVGMIRFMDFQIVPVEVDSAVTQWRVIYTFVFRRALHVIEMEPQWNPSTGLWGANESGTALPSGNAWYAYEGPLVNFASAFPVHA